MPLVESLDWGHLLLLWETIDSVVGSESLKVYWAPYRPFQLLLSPGTTEKPNFRAAEVIKGTQLSMHLAWIIKEFTFLSIRSAREQNRFHQQMQQHWLACCLLYLHLQAIRASLSYSDGTHIPVRT
jgi:hypothetical protein